MKVFLLAPNYCWHTNDLIELSKYSDDLNYDFVADTPIFISRNFYKKYFKFFNITYESVQRVWRLLFCIPWCIYLKIKLSGKELIHCHGLFALLISHMASIPNSRIIFTPQGSDLLVLPDKNFLIKKFLSYKLSKIALIIADSNLLLNKSLKLSSNLRKSKLKLIQNGIPLADIEALIKKDSNPFTRDIDICWIRGLGEIYQFKYFLKILNRISKLSKFKINVTIISAYGSSIIPKELNHYKNINLVISPRLNSLDFLKVLYKTKIVVSIPKSDSSPRSVYEAITLGCQIFATNLECFDWIPTELKSKFIFSSSNLTKDSYELINAIENFDNHRKLSLKKKYPQFYNSLDYHFIAKTYLKTFKKVMKDNY